MKLEHVHVNRKQTEVIYDVNGIPLKIKINSHMDVNPPSVKLGQSSTAEFHSFKIFEDKFGSAVLSFKINGDIPKVYSSQGYSTSYANDDTPEDSMTLPGWIVSFEILNKKNTLSEIVTINKVLMNDGEILCHASFIEYESKLWTEKYNDSE